MYPGYTLTLASLLTSSRVVLGRFNGSYGIHKDPGQRNDAADALHRSKAIPTTGPLIQIYK